MMGVRKRKLCGKPLSSDLERLKTAMTEAAKELVDPITESDIENQ